MLLLKTKLFYLLIKHFLKVKQLIALLFMLPVGFVLGQHEKFLTFELGGSGGLASINYETDFCNKEKLKLAFRTGFSILPVDKNNGAALIFPQMIHGRFGQNQHQADIGIGLAPSITTNLGGAYVRLPLSFGYRLEPLSRNYYLKFAYTPLVSFLFDLQWEHWAGITYGYRLGAKKNSE